MRSKSLISTFNCSLLQQIFPINYLISVKYSTPSAELLFFFFFFTQQKGRKKITCALQSASIWAAIWVFNVRASIHRRLRLCRPKRWVYIRRGFSEAVTWASAGVDQRREQRAVPLKPQTDWPCGHKPRAQLIGCLSHFKLNFFSAVGEEHRTCCAS